MTGLLTINLAGENNTTSRSVYVSGTDEADLQANAQTVLTWYDSITSMVITGATMSLSLLVNATITNTVAGANSLINRVLNVGIRYNAPTLNKAVLRIPSILATKVANKVHTTPSELVAFYVPNTLGVRGDAAQLVTSYELDYSKKLKNQK